MFSGNCVIWDHHRAINYYFSNFFWKEKNEATGFKKSEEMSTALFLLGWVQSYAGEGRRNVGSSMLLPGSEPGEDVCRAERHRRGTEERGSLLPAVGLCLALAFQAYCYEVFLDSLCLPLSYCSVASGCPLGSSPLSLCRGKHQLHQCPWAPCTHPSHNYLQCVFAYQSLNL